MTRVALALACGLAATSPALAAGGGAGSGGAGAQRAINSGLPPGEPGPPGAANNRHPVVQAPRPAPESPRGETGAAAPDK